MNEEVEYLKGEIEKIKDRNEKVEVDKAWETSLSRKVIVAFLTYIVVVIFFYVIEGNNPFVNSIVPTLGFLLSTLTLGFFKKIWIKYISIKKCN